MIFIQGSLKEECNITKLVSILDKSSNQVIKKNPRYYYAYKRFLTKNVTAIVELKLKNRPICLEIFKNSKDFGRFMLRLNGNTVAAGVILDLINPIL